MPKELQLMWAGNVEDCLPIDPRKEGWTFHDVYHYLFKKHRLAINEFLHGNLRNETTEEGRSPFTWHAVTPNGSIALGDNDSILSVFALPGLETENTVTVRWSPETGGGTCARFEFDYTKLVKIDRDKKEAHRKIEVNFSSGIPKFKPCEGLDYSKGLSTVVRTSPTLKESSRVDADEYLKKRTLKIIPKSDYPKSPPIVTCTPEFTDDQCWRSGKLDYAYIRDELVWNLWVNSESSHYALNQLIIMLSSKYGVTYLD